MLNPNPQSGQSESGTLHANSLRASAHALRRPRRETQSQEVRRLGYHASMSSPSCPFCEVPDERILAQTAYALAVRDGYPVSPGHTLIISRRHVASFFEATEEECAEMIALLATVRDQIETEWHPDGYNIGINDGPAAGQTVDHLHIHLIPRYRGDVQDPRGGVRWLLPEHARYWKPDD